MCTLQRIGSIPDAGDFCVSNDLQFICIGRIIPELNNSRYTTIPKVYSFKTFTEVPLSDIDYQCLKNEIGMNTSIKYNDSNMTFSFGYHWDTSYETFKYEVDPQKHIITKIR